MSAADRLLGSLQRVKQTGPGRWLACCPAHEDRSPSLSIRETGDGRVLLHDFGGCDVADVLGALGLAMHDLFDRPASIHLERTHSRIPSGDVLRALDHEITVAVLILEDVLRRRCVSASDLSRLCAAAARMGRARDLANPERMVPNGT